MVLWGLFCLFHFHISEVLNNKTVFTDYITQKLFSYTCNFSHFLKMTVSGPSCWSVKGPGGRNKSFATPRWSPSLKTVRNTPHRLEIQLSGPGKNSHQPHLRSTADTDQKEPHGCRMSWQFLHTTSLGICKPRSTPRPLQKYVSLQTKPVKVTTGNVPRNTVTIHIDKALLHPIDTLLILSFRSMGQTLCPHNNATNEVEKAYLSPFDAGELRKILLRIVQEKQRKVHSLLFVFCCLFFSG